MKEKTQTILLISAGALVVSFILVLALIIPKVNQLKQKNGEIGVKKQELEFGKKKVESLRASEQAIKTAQAALETLGISIPYKEKSEEALAQLAAIAADSSATIKTVSIGASEAGQLNVSITIEGGYDETVKFISGIERNARPAKIRDYSMSYVEDQQSLNSTFNLIFPYIPEVQTTTTAVAPTVGLSATVTALPGEEVSGGI